MRWIVAPILALCFLGCRPGAGGGQTDASGQAGLAIFPGDGTHRFLRVTFSGEQASALELLERSGLQFVSMYYAGLGDSAICQVESVGCGNPNRCFCESERHWSIWVQAEPGEWRKSEFGAAKTLIGPEQTLALQWGDGGASPPRFEGSASSR